MTDFALALGRVLIVALFIWSGFGKLTNAAGFAATLAPKGVPQPLVFAYLAGLAEFGLGSLIAVGFKTRWAALALAAFTLVTIALSHNFWAMTGDAARANMIQAFKNLSIAGGLLVVAAVGAGRYSIDRR